MFSNDAYLDEQNDKKITGILLDGDDDEDDIDIEDDNSQDDDNEEETTPTVVKDPFITCIESLEETVITALDTFKMHPGIKTSPQSKSVSDELKEILTTVLEIGAHTGPIQGRAHASTTTSYQNQRTVDECIDEIYNRINRDLILPTILEAAQSEIKVSKRAAALQFFHLLYKECLSSGSYLDKTCGNNLSISGPYGSGTSGTSSIVSNRFTLRRRNMIRSQREGELLKHWVEASIGCLVSGIFTCSTLEISICSKAILSASASIRPILKYIAGNISAADDAGATRLYKPAMCMIEGVLRRLFCNTTENMDDVTYDAMRSTCIKFLETVVLCFSYSTKNAGAPTTGVLKKKVVNPSDFSLDMLPIGHPIIKREILEEIGDYAFTALRGLVTIGGQVKIDDNLLPDILSSSNTNEESSYKVISIIKPVVLTFLDVMETHSSIVEYEEEDEDKKIMKKRVLDRRNLELDFLLTQKSYALTINALSIAATTRPNLFTLAATTLAERTMDPLGTHDTSSVIITSQLKATCLTLLRNPLSVTSGGSDILLQALVYSNMSLQAHKAFGVAKQQAALKTAGRAARNRAALYYQWETNTVEASQKRKRETDDALAKMRAAKLARGLGNGIQLPVSMVDSMELILINLEHMPEKNTIKSKQQNKAISLDYIIDAIMSNGLSLKNNENKWYERDGGTAWKVSQEKNKRVFEFNNDKNDLFKEQCSNAASDAFSRILHSSMNCNKMQSELSNQILGKLAFLLGDVPVPSDFKDTYNMALDSINNKDTIKKFTKEYPLATTCLGLDVIPNKPIQPQNKYTKSTTTNTNVDLSTISISLPNRILNEAHLQEQDVYKQSLDLYISTIVHSSDLANEKIHDLDRKRVSTHAASTLPYQLMLVPYITDDCIERLSALCNMEDFKSLPTDKKSTIASNAAIHAAKASAEKRATSALLTLRDIAFTKTKLSTRQSAIDCAVSIASGRISSSPSIEDKALKLIMNVIFPKSDVLADIVVNSAEKELNFAADFAIRHFDKQLANETIVSEKDDKDDINSEEEKIVMEKVKKPALLFMALCVRQPETIQTLMTISCRDGADVLSKAVRSNMPKLARAAATKYGAAAIAKQVSNMVKERETPLLLAFLDNLVSKDIIPDEEFVNACLEIQASKLKVNGKKDPRYIVPIVSVIKRSELVEKLPDFVVESDVVFKAALVRMGERLTRQAYHYRDEPTDTDTTSTILGMTKCEQLVFLHFLDFQSAKIPQKRYLETIRLCIEDDEMYSDRVIMSALDHISGRFLQGDQSLPLAYMRTIILTCTKHESLHFWICHVLLPRLIEAKVYEDRRQWEGWMRCAKMLENPDSSGGSGVSSIDAINKLPEEQLKMYRSKYPLAS